MSDNRSEIDLEQDAKAAANKLLSEEYEAFRDDLEILYVRGNLGGRLQFAKKWPAAAAFIFGDELIDFDLNGVKDRNRLKELEDEADERQMGLSEIVSVLEDESVHEGILQMEHVQSVVHALGRPLSLLMYAPGIVERVLHVSQPEQEELMSEGAMPSKHKLPYEEACGEDVVIEQPPQEEQVQEEEIYVPPSVLEPALVESAPIISPVKASELKMDLPPVMFLAMSSHARMVEPSVQGPVEASFDIKNEHSQSGPPESVEVFASERPPGIKASVDPVLKQYVFEDNMNTSLEHLLNPQSAPEQAPSTLTFVPAKKDGDAP